MDEKEYVLMIIDSFQKKLEHIKNNIDDEIKGEHYNLNCLGSDLERAMIRMFKIYYKDYYKDD